MTATISERIIAALAAEAALLDSVTAVERSRADAYARRESGSVCIEPDTSTPVEVNLCRLEWTDRVTFGIYTAGPIPDQLADPIRRDIHAMVMAFRRSINGIAIIDIRAGIVTRELEAGDRPVMWTICPYMIQYQTNIEDLTTQHP